MEEAFYGSEPAAEAGPLAPVCWFPFLAAARLLRPWGAAPSRLTALSSAGRCPPGTSAPASFLKKGCYVPVGRCPTADRVGRREEQKLYVRSPFITLFLRLKAILQLYGTVEHQRAGLGVLIVHAEVALPQELVALPGLCLLYTSGRSNSPHPSPESRRRCKGGGGQAANGPARAGPNPLWAVGPDVFRVKERKSGQKRAFCQTWVAPQASPVPSPWKQGGEGLFLLPQS